MESSKELNAIIDRIFSKTPGCIACTIVEIATGRVVDSMSNGELDPETASAYNVEVVKSKFKAVQALGINELIDDILITLESQYHIISVTEDGEYMIYVATKKQSTGLLLARTIINSEKKVIEQKAY